MVVRQAGTWDPLLSACTWTNVFLSNKVWRKIYRTKNSYLHAQLGQIVDKKIQKDPKPSCPSWRARSKSRVPPRHPAHSSTKGVGRPHKPCLQLEPWTCPYPHPYREPARSPRGVRSGTCCLLSRSCAAAGALVKPCLNFLFILFSG